MSAAECILAHATQLTVLVEQLVLMSSLLQKEHSRTPYEVTFRKDDDMVWFCELPIGHLNSNQRKMDASLLRHGRRRVASQRLLALWGVG